MSSANNTANDSRKQQSEDDFETVNHEDAETPGNTEVKTVASPKDDLSLTRFDNHSHEEEDDSEDDEQAMAHHPIFGMLAGRLGQQRRRGSTHKYDKIHPENQVLGVAYIKDCVEVENSAFPENERCSEEKFAYRMARCPELSLGIFTQPTKAEVENGSTKKRKLIAHIVATRTSAPCVTDATMDFPKDWKTNKTTLPRPGEKETLGHQEVGGTICIHSVAVRPEYQSMGVGSVLLRSYINRIKDAKIADRLALLAHDDMKKFYGRFGFDDMGPSQATFGGGDWNNMILEFSDLQDD